MLLLLLLRDREKCSAEDAIDGGPLELCGFGKSEPVKLRSRRAAAAAALAIVTVVPLVLEGAWEADLKPEVTPVVARGVGPGGELSPLLVGQDVGNAVCLLADDADVELRNLLCQS